MAKDLLEQKLKEFGSILDSKGFINAPEYEIDEFSLDMNDDLYDSFRVEGLRMIYLHNNAVIDNVRDENTKLQGMLEVENSLPTKEDEVTLNSSVSLPTIDRHDNIIDFFNHESNIDTICSFIEDIIQNKREVLPFVKLYFYRKANELKNKLLSVLSLDPLANPEKLKKDYTDILLVLEYISDSLKEEKIEVVEDENTLSDIITIPSSRCSSTILEDILGYEERYKEIRTALDKIMAGYIKNKKDTKQLKGFDKLYEYTHPNGIRILFVLLPNNKIALCSLFFKDKQKSTRITGYYEEALSRFESYKDIILENVSNNDFLLEQFDIVGEIYEELDSRIPRLVKKGSDQDA